MKNNNREKFNLYTQVQQGAVRVLLIVWLVTLPSWKEAKGQGIIGLGKLAFVWVLLGSGSSLELPECYFEDVGSCPIGGARRLQVTPKSAARKAMQLLSSEDYCKKLNDFCEFENSGSSITPTIGVKCQFPYRIIPVDDVKEIFICIKEVQDAHGVYPHKVHWEPLELVSPIIPREPDELVELPLEELSELFVSKLTLTGPFKIEGSIERDSKLAEYLEIVEFTIKNPFELPDGFTNLPNVKEVYIEGPVGELPDMHDMESLESVTVNLYCTGLVGEVSKDILEFVYQMEEKLEQLDLGCNRLTIPSGKGNAPVKWGFAHHLRGSGLGDNNPAAWPKSVIIGENSECPHKCCDGPCPPQHVLMYAFWEHPPSDVTPEEWASYHI